MMINKKKRFLSVKFLLMIAIILTMVFVMQYNAIIVTFYPFIRNVENKIVHYRTHKYQFMGTDHFIIRYEDGINEDVIELVAKTAEDKYRHTAELFKYNPQEKILIVLYNQPEALMKTTMLRKGSPPMGVYYGNAVHILNPIHWVKDQENLEDTFYFEGPLLHELAHLFTDHIGRGNFPLWFTEGVSLYFEYRIDGYEWGKEVIFQDGEYTLENLTNDFHGLNEYLAYTQSFRIINNFVEEEGIDSLMEIIKALGEGKDIEEFIHLF